MAAEQVTIFWSYAHADDKSDGGRLLQLAQHLKNEYALLTGSDLEMFVDRDGIAWGGAWRKEIDAAIVQSSFLLAVITPRYFSRPECRKELLEFHRKSENKDPLEMVLPILYAGVQDLTENNNDEAIAMVARTQYSDWSSLRLAAVESSEYRQAVNVLARRLAELVADISAKRLQRELESGNTESKLDLETLLQESEIKWDEWLGAVQGDEVRAAQHQSVINTYIERRRKWKASRGKSSILLSLTEQEGRDLLPLERLHDEWVEVYSARTIDLDPLVNAVVELARENPAARILLADIQDKVTLAMEQITKYSDQELLQMVSLEGRLARMPFVSQVWKEIRALHNRSDALVDEANEIVSRWHQQLTDLHVTQSASWEVEYNSDN